MPIPKHIIGAKGDECQCGRRMSVRHCPSCGSSRTYGYAQNQWRERLDGKMESVRLFRCIGCGHKFTDEEREWCQAPPVSAALALLRMKAIHEAKERGEYLNPNDEKVAEALQELMVPTSKEDKEKARKMLIYRIQVEYVDKRVELKSQGKDMEEPMEVYTERRLRELGAPEREIELTSAQAKTPITNDEPEPPLKDTPLEKFERDAAKARDSISPAEREFSLEWGKLCLAGRKPTTTVEEYVRRRLAGELFS